MWPRTAEGKKSFDEWIRNADWSDMISLQFPSQMAPELNKMTDAAMSRCFPLQKNHVRSTDDPWITRAIRAKIKLRKKIYKKEDRSRNWHRLKKKTDMMIKEAKKAYYSKYTDLAKNNNDPGLYYKVINRLKDRERPPDFDIRSLCAEALEDEIIANKVANYFQDVISGFTPLTEANFPPRDNLPAMTVTEADVEERLRSFKKPKGLLYGDIFPEYVTLYAKILSTPLAVIYNKVFETEEWPTGWKTEYVTCIPKSRRNRPDEEPELHDSLQ